MEARRQADAAREHHERELEDQMRWAGDDRAEPQAGRDDGTVLDR